MASALSVFVKELQAHARQNEMDAKTFDGNSPTTHIHAKAFGECQRWVVRRLKTLLHV